MSLDWYEMKTIDYTGKIIDGCSVVKRIGSSKSGDVLWECECSCGNITQKTSYQLKKGQVRCMSQVHAKAYLDLCGKKYGNLTVLCEFPSKSPSRKWSCLCDCGNTLVLNSHSVMKTNANCGCSRRENMILRNVGKRYGRVVITSISPDYSQVNKKWICLCDCGRPFETVLNKLKTGHTQSCGCLQKEATVVDIAGKTFGELTVLERAGSDCFQNATWKCRCSCGKEVISVGSSIRAGTTLSCGCLVSKGEMVIRKLLDDQNIRYTQQKRFIGCKDKTFLRFDFYLPEFNVCIEFDGNHHFYQNKRSGATPLKEVQAKDQVKNHYCWNSDIVLIRIPYPKMRDIGLILTYYGIIPEGSMDNIDGG